MEQTWETFKTKPATATLYTDNATVIYVPSGAGARGNAQIRRFYLQHDFKSTTVREQVHSSVKQGNKLFEEVDWQITFNDAGSCTWLLPTIDEGVLVSFKITIVIIKTEKRKEKPSHYNVVTRGLITLCNIGERYR